MTIQTIKFSQMTDGGDIANNDQVPGLLGGGNVLFNNPWTFLPPGSTADRPTPSSEINYRLRFNTTEQLYEYYDAVLGEWTQLQESAFTQGPFLTYTASSSLPDAQNIGLLADGILKQTVTTGVSAVSIAVNGVDFFGPGFVIPGTDGGTGINNGALTINLSGGAVGYILTSDSSGNATWAANGYLTDAVLLDPATDQTIIAHNLFMTAGGFITGSTLGPQGACTVSQVQAVGLAGQNGDLIAASYWDGGAGSAPTFWTYKSRSPNVGAFAAVQAADELGRWEVYADDGTEFVQAGAMVWQATGTISTGVVPGNLSIQTSSSLGVLTAAINIDQNQVVSLTNALLPASGGLGTATAPTAGQIPIGTSGGVYTPAAIASGTNILVGNASGAITISITGVIAGANGGTGHANTGLTINLGSGSTGYLLTSDSSGNATWQAPAYLTGAVLLNPTGTQTITGHDLVLTGGSFQVSNGILASGAGGGGSTGTLILWPTTTLTGSLQMSSVSNVGNFTNTLTNASTSAARTWTLPDASGTIALGGSTIPSIQGTANQVIVNGTTGTPITGTAILLTLPQSIGTTSDLVFGSVQGTNAVSAGSPTGNSTNYLVSYSPTSSLGALLVRAADNAGNFNGFITNLSMSAQRIWSFPDASGTVALTSGIPSLGNYSFSGNNMTVTSGTMNFNLPSSALSITGTNVQTSINVVSTASAASPALLLYSNTSTLIGAIQAGITSGAAAGGTGMLYFNGNSNAAHYFYSATAGIFATLAPTGNILGAGDLTLNVGQLNIGTSAGGGAQLIDIFAPTASMGLMQILMNNNSGNFFTRITNAAFGQSSTLTLQDPGASSANFALAPAALVNGNLIQASGTLGLIADSGISSSNVVVKSNLGDFTFTGDVLSNATTNASINIAPNGTGGLLLGTNTAITGLTASLQIATTNQAPLLVLGAYKATTGAFQQRFYKSRNTTIGAFTAVSSGDNLGQIQFYGDDGAAFRQAAAINITAQGTISSGIVPGQFVFQTANTSGSLTTALTISNAQVCTFANAIVSNSGINFGGSTLANYVTGGTFTPSVSIGGSTTGITYNTQNGIYSRVGNVVTFQATLILTSIGGLTGNVSIDNMPFNAIGSYNTFAIFMTNMTLTGSPSCYMAASSASVQPGQNITGTFVNLNAAQMTNTSQFLVTGSYLV